MDSPLPFILLTLGTLALFLGVGAGVLAAARVAVGGFFQVFLRLLVGLVAVVAGYAIFATRGNTVMWFLLLTMGMVVWRLRAPARPLAPEVPLPWPTQLLLVLGVGLLVGLVRLPLLYDWHTGQIGVPYYDFLFYARLIYPLNELGVETSFLDPIYPQLAVPQPYHFLEIWLNALLARTTGLASADSLYLSTYSVLIGVLYFSYCALFSHFGHSRFWVLALALVCLPLTGFFLPVFGHIALLANVYFDMSNFLLVFPKLTVVALFFVLFHLLNLKGRQTAAGWALASLPIVFISTAPAVAAGFGGWVLYQTWRTRATRPLATIAGRAVPLLLVLVGFVSFYSLNAWLHWGNYLSHVNTSEHLLAAPTYWRHAPAFVAGLVLAAGAYYGLYLVLLAVVVGTGNASTKGFLLRHLDLLALAVMMFAGACLAWFAFTPFFESWQFFNNVNLPLLSSVLVLLVADALAGRRPVVKWLAFLALGLVTGLNYAQLAGRVNMSDINRQYGIGFLNQVEKQAPTLSKIGGFVLGKTDYKEPFAYNSAVFMCGLYLNDVRNDVNMVSLSQLTQDVDSVVIRFPDRAGPLRRWLSEAPICRFYAEAQRRNPALTRPEAMRQFVVRHHINFVCVSAKATLPPALQPLVRSHLTDATTGEKMYLLNVR